MPRTLIVLPTYQEALNIEPVIGAIRSSVPDAHILVVDDASPDRTGELAEKAGAEYGQVSVMHRTGKGGLGDAYRAAFQQIINGGPEVSESFDVVVQMDCDLSHDPATIPTLIAAIDDGADCVIGSRYVPGGSTPGWPLYRRVLSRYGNLYTSALLRLGIRDATSGFRAYRTSVLVDIDILSTRSTGYAFMSEVASRLVAHNAKITEVPIKFEDRRFGTSKMSARIIIESMFRVTGRGLQERFGPPRNTKA